MMRRGQKTVGDGSWFPENWVRARMRMMTSGRLAGRHTTEGAHFIPAIEVASAGILRFMHVLLNEPFESISLSALLQCRTSPSYLMQPQLFRLSDGNVVSLRYTVGWAEAAGVFDKRLKTSRGKNLSLLKQRIGQIGP